MILYIFTISSKKYHFKKIFLLAFFQYSDKTVASTETNDTSAESSWSQLFGSGGCHTYLLQKDIEKKANLTEPSQDAKKKNLIQFLIFLCYELSVCPLIFNSNKVYFASSLIAKPSPDAIGPYGSGQEPMS
jgi:hypothetical protein